MKKHSIIKAIAFISVITLLSSCAPIREKDGTVEAAVPTGEIAAQNVCVDVSTDDNGYYALMSNATINFGDDGLISYIILDDPTLLAFKVSDNYPGGVYPLDGTEADTIISAMEAAINSLEAAGQTETANRLRAALEILQNSGPIEGAST